MYVQTTVPSTVLTNLPVDGNNSTSPALLGFNHDIMTAGWTDRIGDRMIDVVSILLIDYIIGDGPTSLDFVLLHVAMWIPRGLTAWTDGLVWRDICIRLKHRSGHFVDNAWFSRRKIQARKC